MNKILKYLFLIIMFGLFSMGSKTYAEIAYNFKFNGIDGKQINLADYENKVLVVVNVASRCGFTPQYSDLQKVWDDYKNKKIHNALLPLLLILFFSLIGIRECDF